MKKRAGWRFAADGVSSSQGLRHAVVLSAGRRSLLTLLIREGQPPDSIAESHSAERGIVSILAHPPSCVTGIFTSRSERKTPVRK